MSFERLICDCKCEIFAIGSSEDSGFRVTQALCNDCQQLFIVGESAPQQSIESTETTDNTASPKLSDYDECMVEGCREKAIKLGGNGRFCMVHG